MSQQYIEIKKIGMMPRLPLEGCIDLTYRCNNNCRHCWLRIPADAGEKKNEMTVAEIKKVADEARRFGCRKWLISGGEPMLRPDFAEIFEYLTSVSNTYSINTNGTLITKKIAGLMKRKGMKMVALYGATAEVHDHITRNPGSFEAAMRGFAYLKEARAGFIVQLIPMKDNYHQFKDMVSLAESLGKHYRIGAPWLHLSSGGDPEINNEIRRQRLPPKEVVELDKPDMSFEDWAEKESGHSYCHDGKNKYLFSACIESRRNFHVNPYGQMTFCSFIKDPDLLYDLRNGNFKEAWEEFMPSLSKKIKVTKEYDENCGSCKLKKDCRHCPVYGYLEHRRFGAKVDYLCAVAKENKKFKERWARDHRRYYRIADISIQVESDLPFNDRTFHPKFDHFKADGPEEGAITIRHHFSLPDFDGKDKGRELYRKPPWAVYKKGDSWIYLGISPSDKDKNLHRVAVFNSDHTHAKVYNDKDSAFRKGNLHSLTLFPTDQILLARILADREGCFIHACGVDFDGKGLLFVGHSEAGKSTMATMLKGKATILCDDRIIIRKRANAQTRKRDNGFKIYGTWSHGDVPTVSGNSAPLKTVLFLKKSGINKLTPVADKKERTKRLLSCLIKPFVTADWWDKMLALVEEISSVVPCYELEFDKSGKVADLLKKL